MLVLMLILLMFQMKDIRKLFVILCNGAPVHYRDCPGTAPFQCTHGCYGRSRFLCLIGTVIRNSMVIIQQIDSMKKLA